MYRVTFKQYFALVGVVGVVPCSFWLFVVVIMRRVVVFNGDVDVAVVVGGRGVRK